MPITRERMFFMQGPSGGEFWVDMEWDDEEGARNEENGKITRFIVTNTTGIIGSVAIVKRQGGGIWKTESVPGNLVDFEVLPSGPIRNIDDIISLRTKLPE